MSVAVLEETARDGAAAPARPAWRLAAQVARVEARRLASVAVVPAALGLLMHVGSDADIVDLRAASINAAFNVLLLAAVTLVASHRAVTRSRRDGTEELLQATPASPAARTAGHLLAVAAPALIAVAVVAAGVVFLEHGTRTVGHVLLAELAVGPVLVAGAGCLGVLLARLWPQPVTPYVACVAIAAGELAVNTPRFAASGARWLIFWLEGTLWWAVPRHSSAHLAYLVGLVAMAAVGALARHGVTRRLALAAAVAVGVTGVAAALQMRQPQEHWRAVNAMFAEPDAVQRCWTRAGVEYCAFPAFREVMGHVAGMVDAVAGLLPERARPARLTVAQRVTALDLQYGLGATVPHLPDLPTGRVRQPDDGRLHPGLEFGWSTVQELGFGVQLAARAVDLPVVPRPATGEACVAAGQARAVVALWLGSHATDDADDGLAWMLTLGERAVAERGRPVADAVLPVAEADVYGGFVVSLGDVRLALALLEHDTGAVRAALVRHWDELVAPATTTARLAEVLGVALPVQAAGSGRPFLAHPEADAVRIGMRCR